MPEATVAHDPATNAALGQAANAVHGQAANAAHELAANAAHQLAEKRFAEIYEELRSRSWAANFGLPRFEREDAVQEACSYAWQWLLSAAKKGKVEELTPYTVAAYAAKLYKSGRRFAGNSSLDVLDPIAKARRQVQTVSFERISSLGEDDSPAGHEISAAITDSRNSRPEDQVRVDNDYPVALQDPKLPGRAGEFFGLLVEDYGPGAKKRIAQAMKVSPGRATQLRTAVGEALQRIGYGPGRNTAA